MSKNGKNNNQFCLHTKTASSKNINPKDKSYDYCTECGSISINYNDHYYYTLKPLMKQKELEVDPIKVVRQMKKLVKINHPYLDNVFNLNLKEHETKIIEIKEKISMYLSIRKFLLLHLQNITKVLNYSDLSFYHCLLLTDLYLSHNINEDMTEEELLYLLIGFFLVASKFKETDIFEPELYIFSKLEVDFMITVEKILYYEAKCSQYINHDFFIYSTYDWLNIFMGIGYIFEGEIDKENNEELNEIHTYTFKLLITITPKNIFIKYSPLYNAISIVQICREDKIDKNRLNKELFNKLLILYDLKFEDYEKCYNDIKSVIHKYNTEKSYYNQASTLNTTENNKTLDELNNNKDDKGSKKDLTGNSKSSGKKILQFDNRKCNIKQKLQLFPSNNIAKIKKRYDSIKMPSNNSINKNKGFFQKQKTLQIVDYADGNLPKIKKEMTKIFQTEGEVSTGRNKALTIKNDNFFNNYLLKNKKIKNKSGTSLDVKLFIGKSPFGFNRLLRNVTYDALKNNDKSTNKKFEKNNVNPNSTQKMSKKLNKSSDALKYNGNSNIKINNIFAPKSTEKTNYKTNKNSNKKIYKNNTNICNTNNNTNKKIYKNNTNICNTNANTNVLRRFIKQKTSDYLDSNNIKNIKVIKPEKSTLATHENRTDNIIITKKIEKSEKKDFHEVKNNASISKNKERINNINFLNLKNRKFNLINMKYNQLNDLLLANRKKFAFKDQRFPRFKLKDK